MRNDIGLAAALPLLAIVFAAGLLIAIRWPVLVIFVMLTLSERGDMLVVVVVPVVVGLPVAIRAAGLKLANAFGRSCFCCWLLKMPTGWGPFGDCCCCCCRCASNCFFALAKAKLLLMVVVLLLPVVLFIRACSWRNCSAAMEPRGRTGEAATLEDGPEDGVGIFCCKLNGEGFWVWSDFALVMTGTCCWRGVTGVCG